MAHEILISIGELEGLSAQLQNTINCIDDTGNSAVKAAKALKNECDAFTMFLIPALSGCKDQYIEGLRKSVNTFNMAIDLYKGVDRELAKKSNDIDTGLLDTLVIVSNNYKNYLDKYNKTTKVMLDKLADVKGTLQVHRDSYTGELYTGKKRHDGKNGEPNDYGECTTVVRTVALNRLSVLNGVDKVWSVTETWNAQGKGATPRNGSDYPFRVGENRYTADRVRTVEGQSNFDYLLSKISDHPEGVTYYSPYYDEKTGKKKSDHAILISDIIPTGDPDNPYIIFAYDGCSNGGNRDLIQNTKLFKDYIYPGKDPITTQDVISAINNPKFFNYFEFYNKVN